MSIAVVSSIVTLVRAAHGLAPVPVVAVSGGTGGAWNWRDRVVELSPDVAGYTELQQVGLAAHEAFHSVYVDTHRKWMVSRTAPIVAGLLVVVAVLAAAAAFTSVVTFAVASLSSYVAAWVALQVVGWVLRQEERAADRDAARELGPEPLLAFLTHLQATRPMSQRQWWALCLCGGATTLRPRPESRSRPRSSRGRSSALSTRLRARW